MDQGDPKDPPMELKTRERVRSAASHRTMYIYSTLTRATESRKDDAICSIEALVKRGQSGEEDEEQTRDARVVKWVKVVKAETSLDARRRENQKCKLRPSISVMLQDLGVET